MATLKNDAHKDSQGQINSGEVLSSSNEPGYEIGEIIEPMEADISKAKNELVSALNSSNLSSTVEQPDAVYFTRPPV